MDVLTTEGEAGLLTIPIELRLAVYRFIFQGVRASLLCEPTVLQEDDDDDDGIVREPEAEQGRHRRFQLLIRSATASGLISNNALSILLVCRKTHDEARSVFFQMVTFQLRSLVDPTRLISARPSRLPAVHPRSAYPSPASSSPLPFILPRAINTGRQMSAIQHLSIAHSLLSFTTPSKLHHIFPSLSRLQIRQITIPLAHQTLSSLTPHLYTLHRATSLSLSNGESSSSSSPIPSHDMEHHSPGLLLFQTLLCAMDDEAQMEAIMAHASFAAGPGGYALELQFVLKCRHVGMLVVPGMFPMANAPHRHAERDVTYTFNAGGGAGGGLVRR